jgi:photosystem II stability/assembly factor-like uncharacterized protein
MSERLFVATRKGLFMVTRAGGGWRVAGVSFLGDPVTLVMHDPRDGAVYAALEHGHFGRKIHKSTDGGATFVETESPRFPEKPEGLEDKDGSGREVPWSVKLVWALAHGGADQPGRVWCGTIPGGLFRSDDGGVSWTLVRSLWDHELRRNWFGGGADMPGIHSIAVDPRDSRRVTLGVSCGGVWVTEDDGESWSLRADGMRAEYMPPDRERDPTIQDPHCVVQCRAEPDKLWAQHHNGIFRSVDGAASWQEIENVKPSAFGFPTVVHPDDGDTAWFVPAVKDEKRIPVDGKMAVTRTRDGGKTFETLSEGLPQVHAYDLVFRHALDIDASGTRLAMGSTTGSLWVSENSGDSWMNISAHLPPVYAVRFA